MELGELLRNLREERGISQSRLAKDICNRSTLSAYENEGKDIPFLKLAQMLERMNVKVEEFIFQLDLEQGENSELESEFHDLFNSNKKILDARMNDLLNLYTKTKNIFYLALYVDILAGKVGKKEVPLEQVLLQEAKQLQLLRNHLDKVETWGLFEIGTFINAVHLLDESFVIHHVDSVIESIKKRKKSKLYDGALERMLINFIFYFMEKRNFHTADFLVKKFERLIVKPSQVYEKTMLIYFQGILDFFEGELDKGREQIERAICVFELIEEKNGMEELRGFFNSLQRK